jgi:hypothetical protein
VAATALLLLPALQFLLVNSSILYFNPSDPNAQPRENCAMYTQKRIFAFRQVRPISCTRAVQQKTNSQCESLQACT